MSDPVLLEDEYLEAAHRLRSNAALRKQLDVEDTRAKEILAKALAEGETGISTDGEPLVQVKPGARVWNEQAARANLPADLVKAITVTVTEERLDKTKAKDTLAPAIYELCTKANKASVVAL
jgi:hypothetical protein